MISKWLDDETLSSFPLYKQLPSGGNMFFVHITKTAGTSIRRCLGFPQANRSNGLFKKHYSCQEIQEIVHPAIWDNAFKFSFVRNPWDRLYSYYHYMKRKFFRAHPSLHPATPGLFPNFEDWVEEHIVNNDISSTNYRPQYTWIYNEEGRLQVDFLGKFETLLKDFESIRTIIGEPDLQLGHYNSTDRPEDYKIGYSKRTREIVKSVYREDIELFNYAYC